MRVLVLTKIFPNSVEPLSSPFNRQQFAALARSCDVEVLATIPWFPGATLAKRWSTAGRLAQVPSDERIDGLPVRHPRFVYLPKLAQGWSGPLYAASLAPAVLRYRGRVDVVLGSWAYPDGYAAVTLAELLGVPAVIKVHGSDLNVLAKRKGPRRRMEWAFRRAARVVAVSRPLAKIAAELGAARANVDVVPNGIDRNLFHPRDREAARRALGLPLDGQVVLYVGHVAAAKGALDLVRAFAMAGERLRGTRLVLVGDGADFVECGRLAETLRVDATLVGAEPHERIPLWLAACDLLALPSWNEGIPNVVLEALASGRRVVATHVGGIPDVVSSDELGELVAPRDPAALAAALERAVATPYDPMRVSSALPTPSWEGSAELLHRSLLAALEARARASFVNTITETQAV
ncbi:MAG TPA: glycosyltransferase family 4 protein [Polyangiaceae bacterium]|nr:glycosyltransferase family 4 protein [Polyangiaceae bacterium]